ncbi:MAG: hypothetical protein DDT18_01807 [Actinobacteria bacterium]|nr:hypothetical protein [Actinomycetota bacterium]
MSTPGAPTVTPQGITGTTTWGYRITARSSVGETLASTEGRTTTGNAILGATNFNRVAWTAVDGAVDYRIYRTTAGGTPSTTGLIGTTTSLTFDDTGLAASGAVPTIDSSGNVGIGTTGPSRKLQITADTSSDTALLRLEHNTSDVSRGASLELGVLGFPMGRVEGFADAVGQGSLRFYTYSVAPPVVERMRINHLGNVGIGTTGPVRRLEVLQADSVPQLRLSQSATVFSELFIDSAGDLRVSATGQDIRALDENLWVCAGGACPSISISGTGNLVIEGDVYAAGYRRASCPPGMIEVPPSPQDGVEGFCVDKYEAKNVGGRATSQADLTPWVAITQFNARAECIRAGKRLLTEREWQAIAHNIERVGWNWNGGVVGTNQMSDGHSDNVPAGSLAADVIGDPDDDPCVGTGQVCSLTVWDSQRRTYRLSNGQHIWDFGGNVWEWVDQVNEDEYPVHNSPVIGWVACSTTGDGICGNTLTTNDQWFRGGTLATRGFHRGGSWNSGAFSGAFSLSLNGAPTLTYTGVGFRCAR